MGDRLEKLKRMQVAAAQDELPLARALRRHGIEPTRNEGAGGLTNRKVGDVVFVINKKKYSVECQVVGSEKKYDNFSYGKDKVELYRGAGSYDDAYTLLGCYEKKGGKDMIFMLLPAKALHRFFQNLRDEDFGHGIFLNEGPAKKGKAGTEYYTVRPENLAGLEGTVVGSSIDEVVDSWVGSAFPKKKMIPPGPLVRELAVCGYFGCKNPKLRGRELCSSCMQDYVDDPESFK